MTLLQRWELHPPPQKKIENLFFPLFRVWVGGDSWTAHERCME